MSINLGIAKAVTKSINASVYECGDDYWRSYAADPLPLYQSRITQDERELRQSVARIRYKAFLTVAPIISAYSCL